ncbi:MAG: ABC transporter ATP-binding protein [Pyrinomonadaceae bacterium]
MITTQNLGKTFSSDKVDYKALENVNIEIADGECLAIMGKSGSGKSTLMHLLACLDTPTTGEITFDGVNFASLSEKEKNQLRSEKFGFVFQQFFLDGNESVFENVALPLRIRGEVESKIKKRAESALFSVGLAEMGQKRAKELSGGEKQRVCIARALIGSPEIIFADEPTGNLDSKTGEIIESLLFDLNREKQITLIIVTHDVELAMKCERIIELVDGKVATDEVKI